MYRSDFVVIWYVFSEMSKAFFFLSFLLYTSKKCSKEVICLCAFLTNGKFSVFVTCTHWKVISVLHRKKMEKTNGELEETRFH